jgi:hypothetical protein
MNWMQFIAAIVRAVAWPAVVMVAAVLLRRPLVRLIPLLRHLKYGELELEFAEGVQSAREEAEVTLAPLTAPVARVPEVDSLLQLATESPRLAVVGAWRLVESSAHRACAALGVPVERGRPFAGLELTYALRREGVLDDATLTMMNRLRSLRNQAVHGEEFSVDEASAREYVRLAEALAQRIDGKPPETP